MSTVEHYREDVGQYTAENLNSVLRELYALREQLRDDHKARETIEAGRAAAKLLDDALRPSSYRDKTRTVDDLMSDLEQRVTLVAMALAKRDELRRLTACSNDYRKLHMKQPKKGFQSWVEVTREAGTLRGVGITLPT